jgi:hypothetical protein
MLSNPNLMTEVETIIAEAAKMPLRDAAFSLWRQRPRLDTLEGPPMTPEESYALAQRQENPGYLEGTHQAARNHVAYYMK